MSSLLFDVLALAGTLLAYAIARAIANRVHHPLTSPFLIGGALVIAGLVLTGVPYPQYRAGTEPIAWLLGPATVALGVPLYRNLPLLRRNLLPVLGGGAAGALLGAVSVTAAAAGLGMGRLLILSLIPKSVTTPVAVAITQVLGGDGNLTAAMTTLTGWTGLFIARPLLNWAGVRSPMARGLAMGVGVHGTGTALALEESGLAAAMAGLGMTISAVCTAVIAPVIAHFLP